ncbi:hypothetical protein [Methylobacterium planeticum]|uniref:Uncharacterized protein n=1 Tax=Methylobacterium planeticum TaxID=2615211 RepID=A0A6N6MUH3_9HYPH|nr:hypothetical protein [Methylobacterium planeticum]KAB1074072.1 hypothetical protein F6X51_10170 [Methylobacterium planeticum]
MSATERPSPERLARVSELAVKLAEKALAERMLQRPVADQTVTALAQAALLLEEHGEPVPPLALELLTRFFEERRRAGDGAGPGPAGGAGHPEDPHDPDGPTVARKVIGFFRSLRPGHRR